MVKYFVLPVELGRQDGWFGPKRGVYLGGRLEVSCYDDTEGNDVVGVDVDDDDTAIVRKARKLQQRVTNIRIYSDKRGEEVTHW